MYFPRFVEHGSIKPCAVFLVPGVKNMNKMEFLIGLLHRDDNRINLSKPYGLSSVGVIGRPPSICNGYGNSGSNPDSGLGNKAY